MDKEIKKISIEELEQLLASNESLEIEIQSNGEVRAVSKGTAKKSDFKPITFKRAIAEYY